MTAAIELSGVSAGYDGGVVIEDVTLSVERGEFLALIGPNGSGKSTLLRVVLGLLPAYEGRVRLLGGAPPETRVRVGYVPQYVNVSRQFPISVRGMVLMGRLGRTRARFGFRRADYEAVDRALAEVEIGELAQRPIEELSGGQFQRALIARGLATRPELMILDEPTANIDPRVERDLFDLLKDLNRTMTIVVVTHDIGFVTGYAGRVACLNRTLLCHPTESLDARTLERLYDHSVRAVDHAH